MDKMMQNLTPSLFTSMPMSSVERNCETEIVAANIMVILKRTGNTFRKLSWSEYKEERKKDKDFTESEHEYFNRAIKYCYSSAGAIRFCEKWRKIAEKHLK